MLRNKGYIIYRIELSIFLKELYFKPQNSQVGIIGFLNS